MGDRVNVCFGIKAIFLDFPTNLDFKSVREVRIVPRHGHFYAEYVYMTEVVSVDVDPKLVLGIDHGLDNWLTCVSNNGKSFIIDGRKVKSMNQWYNKRIATLKTGKPKGFWNQTLANIADKRKRQMTDAVNKAARCVLDWCTQYRIGTVVFGWNTGIKDGINLGAKTNQEFVQIPTARLKNRIRQLCEQCGIQFIETEESYTSQASFLDDDTLPKLGEKPESWVPSGKRGQYTKGKLHNLGRGGYQTKNNLRVNADCNGAANILRKVMTRQGFCLDGVTRAALTLPRRIYLFPREKVNTSNKYMRSIGDLSLIRSSA
jgi:putative transposase